MTARVLTDEQLLERLADYSGAVGWVSADLLARGLHDEDDPYGTNGPSVSLVGRRLSKLARDGKIEKDSRGGAGIYRVSP